MKITIDGQPVPVEEFYRYAIRFHQTTQGPVPVVYKDGKRVARAVNLNIQGDIEADPNPSGNTAD